MGCDVARQRWHRGVVKGDGLGQLDAKMGGQGVAQLHSACRDTSLGGVHCMQPATDQGSAWAKTLPALEPAWLFVHGGCPA